MLAPPRTLAPPRVESPRHARRRLARGAVRPRRHHLRTGARRRRRAVAAAVRAGRHLRRAHPDARTGDRLRARRRDHRTQGRRTLPARARRRVAAHAVGRVRAELGRAETLVRDHRQRGEHGAPARDPGRHAAACRPARPHGRGRRRAAARPARGRLARQLRPRRRAVRHRRGAAGALPPARGAERSGRRQGARRMRGADRPAAEPGRPRPLRAQHARRARAISGCDAARCRTQPAVARRPCQPRAVRHEPRLVRDVAAGDAGARAGLPRLVAALLRRPARDGWQRDLLLRATGRTRAQRDHRWPARVAHPLRPEQRACVRPLRLRLLHARGLRLGLSPATAKAGRRSRAASA